MQQDFWESLKEGKNTLSLKLESPGGTPVDYEFAYQVKREKRYFIPSVRLKVAIRAMDRTKSP